MYVCMYVCRAIYPSAARDLLLVTSEEEYKKDKKGQAADAGGFVIASTSIDDLCEIKGGPGMYVYICACMYIVIKNIKE